MRATYMWANRPSCWHMSVLINRFIPSIRFLDIAQTSYCCSDMNTYIEYLWVDKT